MCCAIARNETRACSGVRAARRRAPRFGPHAGSVPAAHARGGFAPPARKRRVQPPLEVAVHEARGDRRGGDGAQVLAPSAEGAGAQRTVALQRGAEQGRVVGVDRHRRGATARWDAHRSSDRRRASGSRSGRCRARYGARASTRASTPSRGNAGSRRGPRTAAGARAASAARRRPRRPSARAARARDSLRGGHGSRPWAARAGVRAGLPRLRHAWQHLFALAWRRGTARAGRMLARPQARAVRRQACPA